MGAAPATDDRLPTAGLPPCTPVSPTRSNVLGLTDLREAVWPHKDLSLSQGEC